MSETQGVAGVPPYLQPQDQQNQPGYQAVEPQKVRTLADVHNDYLDELKRHANARKALADEVRNFAGLIESQT